MKVAFWSNVRGLSGATSNLACLSVLGAMDRLYKSVIFENHYNINNLENVFIGRGESNLVKEESYYFNNIGLSYLMRKLDTKIKGDYMIMSSSISLMNEHIYYIPQSHITNQEFLEYELNQAIYTLFQYLEAHCDVVYIDTASSEHLSSKVILHEADLVVVNLNQNPLVLSNFFENYSSMKSKAVYLIGNYNHYSRFNLKNIIKNYHIEKDKIAVIPYNVEFADALSDGKLIKFLSHNYKLTRFDANFYFMNEVKKAMSMLQKNITAFNIEVFSDK